jgi:hypothetical protein
MAQLKRLLVVWGALAFGFAVVLAAYDAIRTEYPLISMDQTKKTFSDKAKQHFVAYFVLCGAGVFCFATADAIKLTPPSE